MEAAKLGKNLLGFGANEVVFHTDPYRGIPLKCCGKLFTLSENEVPPELQCHGAAQHASTVEV